MSEPTAEAYAVAESTGKQVSVWSPTKHGRNLAMIVLTLGSTLEDGTEVKHDTWAVGPTVNEALKRWVKQNVSLAKLVKSRRVVTSGDPADRPESERRIFATNKVERRARI